MLSLLLSGCSIFTPFPSHAHSCLFGGSTVAEDAQCACKRFGDAGLVVAKDEYLRQKRIDILKYRTMTCATVRPI